MLAELFRQWQGLLYSDWLKHNNSHPVEFLADRTNGRAIATLLRLLSSSSSVVVCNVMYCD